MRGYQSLINRIIQNIPSTCAPYSTEHTKDDSLPELLPQKALSFMSSEEMKGNLLRPSVLTVQNENIYDIFDRIDFLEDFHWKPRLKRSHKYYTQTQEKMWVCFVCHGFFIGWTQGGLPFYERVELDMEFWPVNNIALFYKSLVLPCLLGYREVFTLPKVQRSDFRLGWNKRPCKGEQSLLWHLQRLVAVAMCWSHHKYCRYIGLWGLLELPGRCNKCYWQWW